MDSLNRLGPTLFIQQAYDIVTLVARERYYLSDEARPGVTISFETFVRMIFKYSKNQLHEVNLNAEIIKSRTMPFFHDLVVWGISDVGLRTGKGSSKLRGFQEGMWSWILEYALEYGILSEQVQQFRRNLCLREQDGELDEKFFRVYRDFEDGL